MRKPSGFTLIEVVVTIVVVSIAATALMSVYGSLIRSSADPMIQQQATTIGEAYLEEIMLKAFADPTDPEQGAGSIEAGEPSRSFFDDVQDYNHLGTTQVRDQGDNPIAALSAYSITVAVTGAALNSVPAADSMLISISVSHAAIADINLSAYRTNY